MQEMLSPGCWRTAEDRGRSSSQGSFVERGFVRYPVALRVGKVASLPSGATSDVRSPPASTSCTIQVFYARRRSRSPKWDESPACRNQNAPCELTARIIRPQRSFGRPGDCDSRLEPFVAGMSPPPLVAARVFARAADFFRLVAALGRGRAATTSPDETRCRPQDQDIFGWRIDAEVRTGRADDLTAGPLPRRQRVSAAIYSPPAPTDGCEPGSIAAVAQHVPDSSP